MIYFMQLQQSPYLIKIGCTRDSNTLIVRRYDIRCAQKSKILVLAFIPGEYSDEKDLHFKFEEARVRGEWFLPIKRLRDFLTLHMRIEDLNLIKSDSYIEIFANKIYSESQKLKFENLALKKDVKFLLEEIKGYKRRIAVLLQQYDSSLKI